jgi:O-antigen/teichoic acid export membrane protein
MFKFIRKLRGDELFKGSLILFITFSIYNVLNFLFQFLMGRTLGPSNYGVLAVLMSIIYLYGIPTEAIQNLITNHVSRFNLKGDTGKIKYFVLKSLKKSFTFSSILFFLLIPISIFLSGFLKINFWLIFFTNFMLFASFSIPILRGTLQGRKKFLNLGFTMIIEAVIKLGLGLLLVFLGFKVFGAIIAILISVLIAFISSFLFNKKVFEVKREQVYFKNFYNSSIPYFLSMFVILLVFSLDIILAKRFFSSELAGQYAVLSMLGKIIFFGTTAINKAMFPITSERHEHKKDHFNIFIKSFSLILFVFIVSIILFWTFPEFIVNLFYGQQYIQVSNLLVYSGVALGFLSLSNLVLIYGLSTDKLRNSLGLLVFLGIELILLYFYHASLKEYILAFMFFNIIMFIGSLFFIKWKDEKEK